MWIKTTYNLQILKKCSFTNRYSCVFDAVSFAAFFLNISQDGLKSTNHAKLNDSPCASFYGSNKCRQLQRKTGSKNSEPSKMKLFGSMSRKGNNYFKVHFHRCFRAPRSASVEMSIWGGSKSTLMYMILARIHDSFQKFNAVANIWNWFWWNNELWIYKNR